MSSFESPDNFPESGLYPETVAEIDKIERDIEKDSFFNEVCEHIANLGINLTDEDGLESSHSFSTPDGTLRLCAIPGYISSTHESEELYAQRIIINRDEIDDASGEGVTSVEDYLISYKYNAILCVLSELKSSLDSDGNRKWHVGVQDGPLLHRGKNAMSIYRGAKYKADVLAGKSLRSDDIESMNRLSGWLRELQSCRDEISEANFINRS